MDEHGFGRERRLRRRSDFQALREQGSSRAHPLLVLRVVANGLSHPRFGFIVGKRVARKAVDRNRVRRRLRESVRVMPVRAGWDLLFIARGPAANAGFQELRAAAEHLLRGMDLLQADDGSVGSGPGGA